MQVRWVGAEITVFGDHSYDAQKIFARRRVSASLRWAVDGADFFLRRSTSATAATGTSSAAATAAAGTSSAAAATAGGASRKRRALLAASRHRQVRDRAASVDRA